jgi:hypothetical protein
VAAEIDGRKRKEEKRISKRRMAEQLIMSAGLDELFLVNLLNWVEFGKGKCKVRCLQSSWRKMQSDNHVIVLLDAAKRNRVLVGKGMVDIKERLFEKKVNQTNT